MPPQSNAVSIVEMNSMIPDIFEREPNDTTDQWYRVVRDRSDFKEVKEYIWGLWNFFYELKLNDPHFVNEFPVRLFHRWWEMEVAWYLHLRGWSLKSGSSGPDFICCKGGKEIYVEAVMCEPGDLKSENYPKELISGKHENGVFKVADVSIPERERVELLRIRNSIENKVNQYQKHRMNGTIDSKKSYVIALSSAMIPNMVSDDDGIPSIVKAVYPVGQFYLRFNQDSTEATGGGRAYRPKIEKNCNAEVYTNIFLPSELENRYNCVSGLLYSASSFKRTRNLDAIGSTFIFVHNFVSHNPVERCCFGEHMEYWIENGQDENEFLLKNDRKSN